MYMLLMGCVEKCAPFFFASILLIGLGQYENFIYLCNIKSKQLIL